MRKDQIYRTNKTFIEPTRSSYCIDLLYTILGIEVWKQVRDYPNNDVSNMGNVRHFRKGIQNKHSRPGGYVAASVLPGDNIKYNKSGSPRTDVTQIHRLVGKTFIPKTEYTYDMTIDHINQKRDDNRLKNIRFSTKKEQRANQTYPINNSNGKGIWKCDLDGKKLERFESNKSAGMSLMNKDLSLTLNKEGKFNINSICARISHAALTLGIKFGYKWVYDENQNKEIHGEVWATVPPKILYNPVNEYEVSTLGRVRRKKNKKIIKGSTCGGYRVYTFRQKGHRSIYPAKTVKGHRIVALTFLENTENKPVVDHINENKQDNHLENLRWLTHKENKEAHEKITNRVWTREQEEALRESVKHTSKTPGGLIIWKLYKKPDILKDRKQSHIQGRLRHFAQMKNRDINISDSDEYIHRSVITNQIPF